MFPHSTFSFASTGIKPEEEFQEAVEAKVKVKVEPEENEENPQQSLSQFLNQNQIRKRQFQPVNAPNEDDCTHVAFEPAEAKLKFNLKQESVDEKEQDANTTEAETPPHPIPVPVSILVPIPAQTCSFCGKKFPNRRKLNSHLRIHVKKFQCPLCEFKACDVCKLKKHQRSHTGRKPKAQPQLLTKAPKSYIENHHKQESSKPAVKCFTIFYHCDHCDFFTKQDKQLAIHLYKKHNLPRVILKELKAYER